MKKLMLILIFCPFLLYAQPLMFNKVYYKMDAPISLMNGVNAFDGGYLFCGMGTLVKVSDSGMIEWKKDFSGSSVPWKIIGTSDSAYVMVGSDYYGDSVFCMKMNISGDILWLRMVKMDINGTRTITITETQDQGLVILASCWDYVNAYITLIKLTSSGDLLWSEKLEAANGCKGNSIHEMVNGNLLISGTERGTGTAFISMLTSTGDMVWTKKYSDESQCIDAIPYGTQIAAYLKVTYQKEIIVRLDQLGNAVSSVKFYAIPSFYMLSQPSPPSLHVEEDGSLFWMTGGQLGAFAKIDSLGQNIFYNEVYLEGIDALKASDGGYLLFGNGPLMGVYLNYFHSGVIKTDSAGFGMYYCLQNSTQTFQADTAVFEDAAFTVVPVVVSFITPNLAMTSGTLDVLDGCVDMWGGINENNIGTLKILPNPVTNCFQLDLSMLKGSRLEKLEIINSAGAVIMEFTDPAAIEGYVDVSELADGVYLVRLTTEDKVFVGRMVKR